MEIQFILNFLNSIFNVRWFETECPSTHWLRANSLHNLIWRFWSFISNVDIFIFRRRCSLTSKQTPCCLSSQRPSRRRRRRRCRASSATYRSAVGALLCVLASSQSSFIDAYRPRLQDTTRPCNTHRIYSYNSCDMQSTVDTNRVVPESAIRTTRIMYKVPPIQSTQYARRFARTDQWFSSVQLWTEHWNYLNRATSQLDICTSMVLNSLNIH